MYNLPDITFTIQFSYICVLFISGWHHRLNNRAGHKGLTFYKLVPLLRKEAQQVTVAVRLMANGQGGRDHKPTYRRLDSQVQELWEKYSSGEISTARLLRGCSRLYGPTDDDTTATRDVHVNGEDIVTRL